MILVVAEQRAGKLNRATWETIAAAQQLAAGSTGADVDPGIIVVVLGSKAAPAAATSPPRACRRSSPSTIPRSSRTRRTATRRRSQQAIAGLPPTHVLLPHTYQTRDFAPTLAARLDRALVTDVTGVKIGRAARSPSSVRCFRAS